MSWAQHAHSVTPCLYIGHIMKKETAESRVDRVRDENETILTHDGAYRQTTLLGQTSEQRYTGNIGRD